MPGPRVLLQQRLVRRQPLAEGPHDLDVIAEVHGVRAERHVVAETDEREHGRVDDDADRHDARGPSWTYARGGDDPADGRQRERDEQHVLPPRDGHAHAAEGQRKAVREQDPHEEKEDQRREGVQDRHDPARHRRLA